jgi:acetolactate synthase-1/2/3 large subunit
VNTANDQTVSQAIIKSLKRLGAQNAFGVIGGPIGNFVQTLTGSGLNVFHCKHESGAVFAALESSLAANRPEIVFVTTGPGFSNALTGILSARSEGAKLLVVSGMSPVKERGRFVSQDTSSHSFAKTLIGSDAIFDFSMALEHPDELRLALLRVHEGFSKPSGFVAHLGITASVQKAIFPQADDAPCTVSTVCASDDTVQRCVDQLASGSFAIWVGRGAQGAWQEVRTLVELTGAPLLCTPRAKGILPSGHPHYLGSTGLGSDDFAEEFLTKNDVDHVLVLGSRLGEGSSFLSNSYAPRSAFIHVDLNSRVFSAAYIHAKTMGIQAEISAFLNAMIRLWPRDKPRSTLTFSKSPQCATALTDNLVRPSVLMQAIQKHMVDASDAAFIVDVGNAFSFSNRYLEFKTPGRYRAHFDFAAMGCAAAGVLGIAIGGQRKAVALVGDGAFLMHNEINTAVRYQLPCVWIVLNDARYGMVAQAMEVYYGVGGDKESEFPPCDFVQIARGMGADGIRVESELALGDALGKAMASKGPFVVDVIIDKTELAPAGKRHMGLVRQARV